MCFVCFSEQIYYAGPVNNPGFDIPKVRFWFSILPCYLIILLSSFLKQKKVEVMEEKEEGEEEEEQGIKQLNLRRPSIRKPFLHKVDT